MYQKSLNMKKTFFESVSSLEVSFVYHSLPILFDQDREALLLALHYHLDCYEWIEIECFLARNHFDTTY